jgi:leucyl-tRNA synthetase
MKYDHIKIEKKWSQRWVDQKIFSPDLSNSKNPYYALFMFPYPSAEGLHIGNFYAFTSVDVMAKYKKLKGFDVFQPVGFDAFGIHSENYALKLKESPQKTILRTKSNFRKQIISSGIGCDWSREIDTTTPEYYKWTQWIFLKLFEKGLAFRKEALLNWCPDCKTVLADEQIDQGLCERCGSVTSKKSLNQWFFKITDYTERLLKGLDLIDWSEITKSAQRNWIGKSEGAEIHFTVGDHKVSVFTTRPDTIFGATYLVFSPEHPLIKDIVIDEKKKEVDEYIKSSSSRSDLERIESKDKTGVFTGSYSLNPATGEKIPIWIADYVLMNYGTGAIMAVPAHDSRDYEFSIKYKIPIIEVLKGGDVKKEAFVGDGEHINSGFLNGLNKEDAIKRTIDWLQTEGIGREKTQHKIRDWCISRQRYWGPPIPIIYCDNCGMVPVPEKDLPVRLPELSNGWQPSGDGKGPLKSVSDFINVKCPRCGSNATRESDVMDNFLDSAWYFFRYLSPEDKNQIFNKELSRKWLPVDIYIGGNEHAVLHLMYSRFITMFFKDIGIIDFENPFKKFRANGMILKDGNKMSKSKGNVVGPEEYGEKVGYDTLKTYLLFLGPLSDDKSFSSLGISGIKRWVDKIVYISGKTKEEHDNDQEIFKYFDKKIKIIESDIEDQKYNTAIARLMEITNKLNKLDFVSISLWKKFLPLIAPFTPSLAEEMWERIGEKKSIFQGKNWPEIENEETEDCVDFIVQVNGRTRDVLKIKLDLEKEAVMKLISNREKISKWIEGKKTIKIIFVKNKLINICVE